MPTFKDLGYSADIGQMRRVLMAPKGIPADRLQIIRDALAKVNNDKTYKGLIKRIGENRAYIDGPAYELLRPKQSATYKELVKSLSKK